MCMEDAMELTGRSNHPRYRKSGSSGEACRSILSCGSGTRRTRVLMEVEHICNAAVGAVVVDGRCQLTLLPRLGRL